MNKTDDGFAFFGNESYRRLLGHETFRPDVDPIGVQIPIKIGGRIRPPIVTAPAIRVEARDIQSVVGSPPTDDRGFAGGHGLPDQSKDIIGWRCTRSGLVEATAYPEVAHECNSTCVSRPTGNKISADGSGGRLSDADKKDYRVTVSPVRESWLDNVPWLVVVGDREDAFFSLGRHAAARIRSVVNNQPELPSLRSRAKTQLGLERIKAVAMESRRHYPNEWAELTALARGAEVDFQDLLLLNLRGDLGSDDLHGCSDVGWTDGRQSLLGHNEDGDPSLHGQCTILTMLLDGEPAVTTWWYPGFLPGNTFTINEHGLVWGLDAIHVTNPPIAPGRGFVARRAQRVADIGDLVEYLYRAGSAGGWAYMVGNATERRIVSIESAGGQAKHREADAQEDPYLWHTNHLCYLPTDLAKAASNSLARGKLLAGPGRPEVMTRDWILGMLTGAPLPAGVRATGLNGSGLTLCTLVADFAEGEITLAPHESRQVTLPIQAWARPDTHTSQIEAALGSLPGTS